MESPLRGQLARRVRRAARGNGLAARSVPRLGPTLQIETAYLAIRHTLLDGRVLRSKDPAGIEQEMWAILTVYQALRTVMCEAAESHPGTDPDRMSFTLALETARNQAILANLGESTDRLGAIGRAVLAAPNPARRPRYSARKLKSPGNRYTYKDPTRPTTSTPITDVEIHIQPPAEPSAPNTPLDDPEKPPGKHHVLDLLRQTPDHPRRLREIAAALGISGRQHTNRLGVRLSRWAHQGLLTKTAPGTYTIKKPPS